MIRKSRNVFLELVKDGYYIALVIKGCWTQNESIFLEIPEFLQKFYVKSFHKETWKNSFHILEPNSYTKVFESVQTESVITASVSFMPLMSGPSWHSPIHLKPHQILPCPSLLSETHPTIKFILASWKFLPHKLHKLQFFSMEIQQPELLLLSSMYVHDNNWGNCGSRSWLQLRKL